MFINILLAMLADRTVDDMTCREARQLVNDFEDKITILTNSWTNQSKVDYFINEALAYVGLEQFA